MTPAEAVRDALAPLALAGYAPTPSGLVEALADLGEARSLLAQWQADGETVAVMQHARAHLDAARGRRSGPAPRRVRTFLDGPTTVQDIAAHLLANENGPKPWRDGDERCHCSHCSACGRLYRTADIARHREICPVVGVALAMRAIPESKDYVGPGWPDGGAR